MEGNVSLENSREDFFSKGENFSTKEDIERPATNIFDTIEEVEEMKIKKRDQEETFRMNNKSSQDDKNIDDSHSEEFDVNRLLNKEMKDELVDNKERVVHHGIKIEDIKLEKDGSAVVQVKQEIEDDSENEIE